MKARQRVRIRRDLIAGEHPDDPERVLVMSPRTKKKAELSAEAWKIARAFDGDAGAEVIAQLAAELGEEDLLDRAPPGPARPAKFQRVDPQWTVAPRPDLLPLAVHRDARFGCQGAGTCCESGFVIPLNSREVVAVRGAARELLPDGAEDPVCLMPTGRGSPWTYALATEPRCAFLDDEARCAVHETAAQPNPCRVFPYRFVVGGDEVHVSVSHRCVCGTLDRGELLAKQRPEIRRRLRAVSFVHQIPDVTAIDAENSAPSDDVISCVRSAVEGRVDAFAMLRALSGSLLELCARERPRARSIDPASIYEKMLAAIGASEKTPLTSTLARAFSGAAHEKHAMIDEDLRHAGLYAPRADARAEVGRFARDFVFGLQIYRFATLSSGILAVALASARILRGLPAAAHPIARERIMLWESTLTSKDLPGILGPAGPVAKLGADLAAVDAQIRRLEAYSEGR